MIHNEYLDDVANRYAQELEEYINSGRIDEYLEEKLLFFSFVVTIRGIILGVELQVEMGSVCVYVNTCQLTTKAEDYPNYGIVKLKENIATELNEYFLKKYSFNENIFTKKNI